MSSNSSDDFQKLVYARIQAMPEGTTMSIGGGENLSKKELLQHVNSGDEIGEKLMEIEKAFFQMLKEGTLYKHAS